MSRQRDRASVSALKLTWQHGEATFAFLLYPLNSKPNKKCCGKILSRWCFTFPNVVMPKVSMGAGEGLYKWGKVISVRL